MRNLEADLGYLGHHSGCVLCADSVLVRLSWLVGLLPLSLLVSHLSLSLVLGWLADFQEHPHRCSPRG